MAAIALTIPGAAESAVTIGEDMSAPADGFHYGCDFNPSSRCTFLQTYDPLHSYVAPFDGVIVRWRMLGDSLTTQFTLRVLRNAGVEWTGVGTSEPRTVAPGVENVFGAQLQIHQGEAIGLEIPGGDPFPSVESTTVGGAQSVLWNPALGDGETRVPSSPQALGFALLYNADIEPDCDSDGLGDETQDSDISSCQPSKGGRTLILDASKNKVKKGRKVLLSGQLDAPGNESACESNLAIELQRKTPAQAAFSTLEHLGTDVAGSFSTKQKVKKTFEYRAEVVETDACLGQVSNTEKVKAKKKK